MQRMLKGVERGDGRVLFCGSCMDAHGVTEDNLIDGATRSNMQAFAALTLDADKVLVFRSTPP